MGIAAYVGGFARAETVAKLAEDHQRTKEKVAGLDGVVHVMAGQLNVMFELKRQEAWDQHHILIPDPAAPDAGVPR
jgi:hypothetical protein